MIPASPQQGIKMSDPGYIGPPKARSDSTSKALTLEAKAQQVLDELLSEGLIPFKLNVGKLTKAGEEYTLHFHDSRIHSAKIPLTKGHLFRDMVRAAVLARVAKMSGPLRGK
jgi:hypothetical protein